MKKEVVIELSFILALFLLTSCGNQNNNVPSTTEIVQEESELKEFQWSDNAYDPNVANTTVEEKTAEAEPVESSFAEDRWKTETYGGITFTIDSSWEKELREDGVCLYYPSTTDPTGFIQCVRIEHSIGKVTDDESRTLFDSSISGGMGAVDNAIEISRSFFFIGDKHALRISYYYDLEDNDINDDDRGRMDTIMVLFEDSVTILNSIFTTSEYEYSYKDIIETALGSVELKQLLDQPQAETTEYSRENTKSVFSPQDVSDKTIKSIETYDDYLKMYEIIILNYFANYEATIKGTVLYSEDSFTLLKSTYEKSFEQQRDMYGAIGKSKIIGKDDLVKFLIDYRNSLKDIVETLKKSLE